METYEVIYSSWYLSDRWGSNEDNGCTLHINLADFQLYVQDYHNSFTNELVIGTYFVPRKPRQVRVSKILYNRILVAKNGLNISLEEEQDLIKSKELIIN
jgi:hypothetical protein